MTMTESPPAADAASDDAAADDEPAADQPVGGLYGLLTTSDHKTIGRLYIGGSLVVALGLAVVGVLLGLERVVGVSGADDLFAGDNNYFQYWTLYRVGLVIGVAMPLFIGLALVVVPMQIGATNVAFPRAVLASFWSWFLGAGMTAVAVFAGGGWGALDAASAREEEAIALTLAGTAFTIVALLLAALCIATTVISLRTAGMNLMRVPIFAWSILVAATTWLFTFPIALANIVLIYVDLRGREPIEFGVADGPEARIWSQLDWVFTQPAIYSLLIPSLGVAAAVVPVVAKTRSAHHAVAVTAIGLFGLLSLGGWIQPYMTAPVDYRDELVYVAFGIAALLPPLMMLGVVLDNLRRGISKVAVPPTMLIGAVGAALVAAGTALIGAIRVIEPWELLERSTTTGLFNAVIIASLLAVVGGLWFWAPKILGTLLPERAGRLAAIALLLGGFVLVVPDVISGFMLGSEVSLSEPDESAVEAMNFISMVGAVAVAAAVALLVLAYFGAMRPGRPAAGDDPWDGHTLEWATTSPPPPGNFAEPLAKVGSESPLLDQRDATASPGADS